MSGENYTNTASTATTAAPVGAADTAATLASFTGWPSTPFWGEFEKGTASAEIVRVTGVAGSNITAMTRGQGGTAAATHGAGVNFEHVAPADFFNRAETHQAASTAVHGVTGSVVGTSGSQTVQDKTFRGAHTSTFSDALPAGVTASYLSTADNANARDGFVHNNTAGSASRAAFKLTQSGTDRFTVSNTGNLTINPSTGTALTVTGNATVSGTSTLTGALTANGGIVTTGQTISTSGLVVSAGGLLVSGNATFNNNVSATGTIHANGSIDTDTNLVVDGTSTLTGAVAAGAALTVGTTAAVTQGITSWGSRVPMSVSSTSVVTTPVTGDLVWDRSAKLWKEWTGSAWAIVDRPYAFLRQTVAQNFSAATFTAVTFTTEDFDSVNGHNAVANTSRYTCQAGFDGVYRLAGQVDFATNTSGSRTSRWSKNGTALNAGQGPGFDAGATSLAAARTMLVRLAAGDYVELEGYQSSGATLATNVAGEFQSSMSVEWIAP